MKNLKLIGLMAALLALVPSIHASDFEFRDPDDNSHVLGTWDSTTNPDELDSAGGFKENGSDTLSNNVSGNAGTATALSANGTNCSAGQVARGVDASGNAEDCFTPGGGGDGWTKYTKTYDDFDDVTQSSHSITLFSLASGGVIEGIVIKHTTACSGGAASGCSLRVGIEDNEDKHAGPFDVFQAVGNTVFQTVDLSMVENIGSATSILVTLEVLGDTTDNITAGSFDIYVKTSTLP